MSGRPDTYEKIHLQTKGLRSLYQVLNEYLSEKIDEQLTEMGLGIEQEEESDDKGKGKGKGSGRSIRSRVRKLVLDQFLDRLFNAIKYSVELDDSRLDSPDDPDIDIVKELIKGENANQKVEPYDFALNDKLRGVYLQVEDKIEEVTKLRKVKPTEYYNAYKEMLLKNESWIDSKLEENTEFRRKCLMSLEKQSEAEVRDTNEESDFTNLKEDYEKYLENIALLKKDIPDTMSQLDNLISVVQFLNNQNRPVTEGAAE
ncbi:DEKNAAC102605 [Brettanomyces naardenensis]|uniref:DEKNAAC102605 n=1 Tax=Brettanomyces naardenensis TaxID=13370 RepID=A0A448YK81_BRENA|nr:DEKNAAC102605 [Brettanomyces naardenensis]